MSEGTIPPSTNMQLITSTAHNKISCPLHKADTVCMSMTLAVTCSKHLHQHSWHPELQGEVIGRTFCKPTMLGCIQVSGAAAIVFARHGYTATLSWRLPQPGVREFTVRQSRREATLFHVTNYNKVNIASAYRTRAVFTGNINSSGSGVFSFLLNDVVWKSDDGFYRCHRGSPGSTDQISNCFQEIYVIYIQDPYIVASETIPPGSSAMLTCSSFTRSYFNYYYYIPDVYFTWRKNGDQLETGGRLHLTEDNERLRLYHYRYYSTLTISAVRKEGDHYTCQGGMNQMWMTNWSEEYTLGRTLNATVEPVRQSLSLPVLLLLNQFDRRIA
ncbi:uncharacterized protein LOC124120655 [Haliotis rufescens]|uniref:uncharacterized protein LOC124120655 n=1 Tax=Haliotis rufescens TaxID=6454 RepID=UPI00201EAB93|nr:uncharacterized protein LOC124120655 [Haliotis rufescens]